MKRAKLRGVVIIIIHGRTIVVIIIFLLQINLLRFRQEVVEAHKHKRPRRGQGLLAVLLAEFARDFLQVRRGEADSALTAGAATGRSLSAVRRQKQNAAIEQNDKRRLGGHIDLDEIVSAGEIVGGDGAALRAGGKAAEDVLGGVF